MDSKTILTAVLIGIATAGPAAAQLPGIAAPTGADTGTAASRSSPDASRPDTAGASGGSDERRAGARMQDRVADPAGVGTLKDAIELCERLAGVEREICLRQAQENRERA